MTAASEQSGLWDREIEDHDLLDAQRTIESHAKGYKEYLRAVRTRKRLFLQHEPGTGERLKAGDRVFQQEERQGGGFSVKQWRSRGIRRKVVKVKADD